MNNLKTQINQLKLAQPTTSSTHHSRMPSTKASTAHSSSTSSGPHSSKTCHREVALTRYHSDHVHSLPVADQVDIELFPHTRNMQAVPHYACDIYTHLRCQEYNEPNLYTQKPPQDIQPTGAVVSRNLTATPLKKMALESFERDKVAKRVLELCKEKGYRLETWLIAVNILDRFLSLGANKLLLNDQCKVTQIPCIVTTVTIMAAKLE